MPLKRSGAPIKATGAQQKDLTKTAAAVVPILKRLTSNKLEKSIHVSLCDHPVFFALDGQDISVCISELPAPDQKTMQTWTSAVGSLNR